VRERPAQGAAVERAGQARAARVDEQHVAAGRQRTVEGEEEVAAVGGGVARAALDVDERAELRARAVAPPVELEPDADLLARRRERSSGTRT
jgi:hypothetical protein